MSDRPAPFSASVQPAEERDDSEGCAVWILFKGLDFRDAKSCSNAWAVASRRTAELEELMSV